MLASILSTFNTKYSASYYNKNDISSMLANGGILPDDSVLNYSA